MTFRFTRAAAATAVLAAAAVVLAGCDSNPSVAAYVGDQHVSTRSLGQQIKLGLDNAAVSKTWGSKKPAYRRQVLDNAVYHALITQVADREGVSSSPNEDQAILTALRTGVAQQGGGGTSLETALASSFGIAPSQESRLIDDIALTGEVALRRGLLSLPKQYRIGIIQVDNRAEAVKVQTQLRADESSYTTLAKRHPAENTLPSPVSASETQFVQSFGQAHAKATAHSSFLLRVPGSTTAYGVIYVFSVTQPSAKDLTPQQRASAVINVYTNGRKSVVGAFHGKIRINPRFGRWDAGKGQIADTSPPTVLNDKS